ncbi:MAG: aldolase/citrate lyase family protein [Bryobacteraceae bacterium]|nr:aldolase/citrate lyase family protein [Bryobacteraceae bacterium]MDW8379595.1 aldolase/citrate lyase family protein [Bryobacterales bacterium]
MKPNRFRKVVAEGRIPVGHMIMEFGTRGIAMIHKAADLDFVVIDMEHTGFDTERVADLVAFYKATDIAPFVRVPQPLYHFLARTLDAGALGVMIGNVETPEQAKSIVEAVKYAPLGKRGLGLGTAHNDYVVPDPVAYLQYANENTTVICQIESPLGVSNVEAICATPGVDCVWVGHFDLSSALGIPGQFQHPDFLASLQAVVAAAHKHHKLAGIQPGDAAQADQWIALGFNVISWKADIALYRSALQTEIQALRAKLSKQACS